MAQMFLGPGAGGVPWQRGAVPVAHSPESSPEGTARCLSQQQDGSEGAGRAGDWAQKVWSTLTPSHSLPFSGWGQTGRFLLILLKKYIKQASIVFKHRRIL